MHGPKSGLRSSADSIPVAPPSSKTPSIHRAANGDFDPEQYTWLDTYDMNFDLKEFYRDTKDAVWPDDVPHGDQCTHCGKRLRYVALLKHASGESITVGETCLGDRFSISKEEFRKIRERGKQKVREIEAEALRLEQDARLELMRKNNLESRIRHVEKVAAERAEKFAEHPNLAALTYPEMFAEEFGNIHELAVSLNRQLDESDKWLSEAQVNYFMNLWRGGIEGLNKQQARERRQAEAIADGVRAPRGKGIEVVGTVTNVKYEENVFAPGGGMIAKMRVGLPGGAGVYVTVPEAISGVRAGDQVRFTANFEAPKDDDPLFAYGKRPRGAEILD